MSKSSNLTKLKIAMVATTALAAPFAAHAQSAAKEPNTVDEIVVTGFRQSLEKALVVKRELGRRRRRHCRRRHRQDA